jgi:phosphatidylserine decarboxylase
LTGQTSVHEPHRLHACGKPENRFASRAGARIDPIGPGTGQSGRISNEELTQVKGGAEAPDSAGRSSNR